MSTVNIAGLCRICVNPSYYHVYVFNKLSLDGNRLFEAINAICQLNIIEGDGLPEYICSQCNCKVSEIEVFKQNSQKGTRKLLSLQKKELAECVANEGGISRCSGSEEIEIEEHHPFIKIERVDEGNEGDFSEEYGDGDNSYCSTNKADIEPPNKAIAQANLKSEDSALTVGCQNEEESMVDVSLNHQHEIFIKVEPQDYVQCIDADASYPGMSESVQIDSQMIAQPGISRGEGVLEKPLDTEEPSGKGVTRTRFPGNHPRFVNREEDMKYMTPGVTCTDRLDFELKLFRYLRNQPRKRKWSRPNIQEVITVLNDSKDDELHGKTLSTHQLHYMTLYDTSVTCAGLKLFYKQEAWKGFIIPYEDFYDILFEYHAATFHGNTRSMRVAVGEDSTIPKEVVALFVEGCGYHKDRAQRLYRGAFLPLGTSKKKKNKKKYRSRTHFDKAGRKKKKRLVPGKIKTA